MATTAASYRNPQPPQPRIQQEEPELALTPGQVARDIEDLCAMGFIEAFRDEHNIVRYRPILKEAQAA